MLCWSPVVTELPANVRRESRSITREPSLFYPYWLVPVQMRLKLPFLPAREGSMEVAVDALNGGVGIPPNVKRLDVATGVLPALSDLAAICWGETILRVASSRLPSRLRPWTRCEARGEQAHVVCKELRLFAVEFLNDTSAQIALDTLSGDYGILGGEYLERMRDDDGRDGTHEALGGDALV